VCGAPASQLPTVAPRDLLRPPRHRLPRPPPRSCAATTAPPSSSTGRGHGGGSRASQRRPSPISSSDRPGPPRPPPAVVQLLRPSAAVVQLLRPRARLEERLGEWHLGCRSCEPQGQFGKEYQGCGRSRGALRFLAPSPGNGSRERKSWVIPDGSRFSPPFGMALPKTARGATAEALPNGPYFAPLWLLLI
jgi:hypothetical protein